MTIPKIPRWALLLVCVSAALIAWQFASRSVTAAEANANKARQETKQAVADAGRALTLAGIATRQADSLKMQRDSAAHRAATFEQRSARLTGRLAALEAAAPDTCRRIILVADSALATKDSVISELHVALDRETAAELKVTFANDTLTASLTKLRGASTSLVKADEKVVHRRWLKALIPSLGVGVTAGFNPAGKPDVVSGITLGWHF